MPENTCIALYVPLQPGVSLKVTNFERSAYGETTMFSHWKLYKVDFIDFREYHAVFLGVFETSNAALREAHEIAQELPY